MAYSLRTLGFVSGGRTLGFVSGGACGVFFANIGVCVRRRLWRILCEHWGLCQEAEHWGLCQEALVAYSLRTLGFVSGGACGVFFANIGVCVRRRLWRILCEHWGLCQEALVAYSLRTLGFVLGGACGVFFANIGVCVRRRLWQFGATTSNSKVQHLLIADCMGVGRQQIFVGKLGIL